jgi:hypothetical protein
MSWFPLNEQLMEGSPEFRVLTPAEKVFLLFMISEFNLRRKHFYKSDLEAAVTLGVGERTIRRGRKKLIELGWIKAKPGTLTRRGKCLATTYLWIKWATISPGGFFAQMDRHAFNVMLYHLRKGEFSSADLVVYVYLCYWHWRNRGKFREKGSFYMSKEHLCELTNLADAPGRVERLYDGFTFREGAHLFEYGGYQKLIFTTWNEFADPEEDEDIRLNAEAYTKEIMEMVKETKELRNSKLDNGNDLLTFKKIVHQGGLGR